MDAMTQIPESELQMMEDPNAQIGTQHKKQQK